MHNNSNLLLAALVILGAISANGCGLLNQKTYSPCSPCDSAYLQPAPGNFSGGSWQWVPDYQQPCNFPTSSPYAGYCIQCGRNMLEVAARSQCAMSDPRQVIRPATPIPTKHHAAQEPPFTSPLFPTHNAPEQTPSYVEPSPAYLKESPTHDLDGAMDQFPDESHSERDESPEPERGELPPPKEFPDAAQNPTDQDGSYPILHSPISSMEPAGYQDAIFHPMPGTPMPASLPIYPRTEGSGPDAWIRYHQSQATLNQ